MTPKGLRVEFPVPKRQHRRRKPPPPPTQVPRLARLLALAHKWEGMVRRGEVQSYADIARRRGLTRARVTQIGALCRLAPDLQEALLTPSPSSLPERRVRAVARLPLWPDQRRAWPRGGTHSSPAAIRRAATSPGNPQRATGAGGARTGQPQLHPFPAPRTVRFALEGEITLYPDGSRTSLFYGQVDGKPLTRLLVGLPRLGTGPTCPAPGPQNRSQEPDAGGASTGQPPLYPFPPDSRTVRFAVQGELTLYANRSRALLVRGQLDGKPLARLLKQPHIGTALLRVLGDDRA